MGSDAPARNRVTPLGDVVAAALRGAWTGNRGCLHRGHEIVRFHASDLWITCALRFRDRHREQWLPNRFTWLYFHDEAVAFAAGHRPCCECRRPAYTLFRDLWAQELEVAPPRAHEMNRRLHGERIVRGTHRRRLHPLPWQDVPDGCFVLHDGMPHLVLGARAIPWSTAGYAGPAPRPARGEATMITPPTIAAVLAAGYPVQIDPGALAPSP